MLKISRNINRKYSNFSNNNTNNNNNNNNSNKDNLKFDSLLLGFEKIKNSFLGVSGVYKLTNKQNVSRFYIGSSVNLARRMEEYYKGCT